MKPARDDNDDLSPHDEDQVFEHLASYREAKKVSLALSAREKAQDSQWLAAFQIKAKAESDRLKSERASLAAKKRPKYVPK